MTGSVVAPDAELGEGSEVGPFCVLGIDPTGEPEPLRCGPGAVIRSHTVVYRGVSAGGGLQTGHGALVREHTVIGDDVSIGSHSILEHHVTVGDDVRIHSNCFVPEHSILEDGAWLGPGVVVTNARYPNRPDTKQNLLGVHVEAGATVGAAVVILPGVRIGAGALVGAGAVVVRDVEPGETVVGNPGRVIS